MRVQNMEINFFPKCHSKSKSNFPFIVNLKKRACASKQDGLVFATLLYVSVSFCIFLPSSFITTSSAIREMRVFGLLHHHQLECRRTANEAGWEPEAGRCSPNTKMPPPHTRPVPRKCLETPILMGYKCFVQ